MAQSNACERNLEIEVPAGEVEREYQRIAVGIQRKARIPGFRPGKAPLSLVRKHFDGRIREELLEALLPAHLRSALEAANLEPVSTPKVSDLDMPADGQPLRFKASFEVMPAIELGDYRSIRTTLAETTVLDSEIEEALEQLREREAKQEPIEPPASGLLEAADGMIASAVVTPADKPETETPHTVDIEIGGKSTLPEFSTTLRGMSPGGERELEVTYPEDHPNKQVAGTTARYRLQLKELKRKVLPDMTDAYVKEHTGAETVAELKTRIRVNLEEERREHARHEAEDRILDELIEQKPFPVPEALVEQHADELLERRMRALANQGIDPRQLKLDWGAMRNRYREPARREVRISLALDAVARQEKLEASAEEVEQQLTAIASETGQKPEALRARLAENGMLERMKDRIRQDKTRAFLLQQATSAGGKA